MVYTRNEIVNNPYLNEYLEDDGFEMDINNDKQVDISDIVIMRNMIVNGYN